MPEVQIIISKEVLKINQELNDSPAIINGTLLSYCIFKGISMYCSERLDDLDTGMSLMNLTVILRLYRDKVTLKCSFGQESNSYY